MTQYYRNINFKPHANRNTNYNIRFATANGDTHLNIIEFNTNSCSMSLSRDEVKELRDELTKFLDGTEWFNVSERKPQEVTPLFDIEFWEFVSCQKGISFEATVHWNDKIYNLHSNNIGGIYAPSLNTIAKEYAKREFVKVLEQDVQGLKDQLEKINKLTSQLGS